MFCPAGELSCLLSVLSVAGADEMRIVACAMKGRAPRDGVTSIRRGRFEHHTKGSVWAVFFHLPTLQDLCSLRFAVTLFSCISPSGRHLITIIKSELVSSW